MPFVVKLVKLLLTSFLLFNSAFGLDGLFQAGYGPKSKGMGGVGIALPQDSYAPAQNPAGNVLVGDRIDLGLEWIQLSGRTAAKGLEDPDLNGKFRSSQGGIFPEIGLNWMICEDMSLGLAFYLNGLFDVDYERGLPLLTDTKRRVRAEYHQYFITPAWSWMIHECHMLGVALHIAFARARFLGLENIAKGRSISPNHISPQDGETNWGGGARFGYVGHFWDRVSIGLVYQTKIWMAKYKNFEGFLPDRGDFDTPSLLGAGIAVCITPELVASIDVERVFWSDVESFGNTSDSKNDFGKKCGPGFGWDDAFIFKGGIAYDLLECLTLRLGYNYGHSPISSSEVKINGLTLATTEHHVTAGASYLWGNSNELTIAYIHGFENCIHHKGHEKICNSQNSVSLSIGHCF